MTRARMHRRSVLTLLGASAAAWSLAALAQQDGRVRRVGVLTTLAENDPLTQARVAVLQQSLEKLGWTAGRNVRIDYRSNLSGNVERARAAAGELLALEPDVILVQGSNSLEALQQATKVVPIVFLFISEPVEQGFVTSLARPGGNITGFTNLEPTVGGKWLQLLKEIAPRVLRAAFVFSADNAPALLFARHAATSANQFGVAMAVARIHTVAEIETVLMSLVRELGRGLIIPPDTFVTTHRKRIIELTTLSGLPLISANRLFVDGGGLMSYGIDPV